MSSYSHTRSHCLVNFHTWLLLFAMTSISIRMGHGVTTVQSEQTLSTASRNIANM